MARYDREFLVPYLRDVCTLELMKKKLEDEEARLKSELSMVEYKIDEKAYLREKNVREDGCLSVVGLGVGAILFYPAFWGTAIGFFVQLFGGPSIILTIGLVCFALMFLFMLGGKSVDVSMRERHNASIADQRAAERNRLSGPLNSKLSTITAELSRVKSERNSVYAANVIPDPYRDIYAAVYLNDYFSTSRSDDLDMALNTFELNQIKARLDTIIAQQSRMLINQSIMIAKQQWMQSSQEAYREELCRKLDGLNLTMSEQTHYLGMIESHLKATNYFAADQYFHNHSY